MEALLSSPEFWAAVVGVLGSLATAAVIITKTTSSPTDDQYAAAFLRAVQAFAGMFGAKPKP